MVTDKKKETEKDDRDIISLQKPIFLELLFFIFGLKGEREHSVLRENKYKKVIIIVIISIVNNNSNGNELVDWGNNWAISPLYNGYRAGRRFEPYVHKLRMGREFTSLRGNNER